MAKIRHKITKHTTQEVTLDQNNAFKAQKYGNTETFQLRFNDRIDYPLNEVYSINKKVQSQKAIICKNISSPSSSENCLEVSTSFSDSFYFEFEINTDTLSWFASDNTQYSLENFELEVYYTESGTTQFINLYYNDNAVPGPVSDSWLTGEYGPGLTSEDLRNGIRFFTEQFSSNTSHVILKIKGEGAVSLTQITAKKYSDDSVLKNYLNPYKEMSGITSSSTRKIGRNINNKTSLPDYYKENLNLTASRNAAYFDTDSFVFNNNSNINIVEQMPADSKFDSYINNIVSTPNTSPNLQSQGSFKSYHLDDIIDRSLETSAIKPYNDEYSYSFQDNDFFASSSNPYNTEDNFTGFGETTSIEINLDSDYGAILSRANSTTYNTPYRDATFIEKYEDDLTLENGFLGKTEWWNVANRPMAFFDFENSRWEYIVSGSNTLYNNSGDIEEEIIGFSPGSKYVPLDEKVEIVDGTQRYSAHQDILIGSPTRNFGFPNDTRFTGFNRNLLKLSDYLQKPFALEKVSYEFTFSSRGYDFTDNSEFVHQSKQQNVTFFILNQFNDVRQTQFTSNKVKNISNEEDINVLISPSTVDDSISRYYSQGHPYSNSQHLLDDPGNNENINALTTLVSNKSHREIITFNNVFLHSVSNDLKQETDFFYTRYTSLQNVVNDASFSLDAGSLYFINNQASTNEPSNPNIDSSLNAHKYNVKLKDYIRSPLLMDEFGFVDGNYIVDNKLGDKDLNGTPSIRSNDTKISPDKNGLALLESRFETNNLNSNLSISKHKTNYSKRPYVLKPEDTILVGVELNKLDTGSPPLRPPLFYIHPGQFKLILHGRYLKNNRLVNDSHSSNLNSKSINSTIIGNTFPQDQFVEPINIKENTYVDRKFTGNITLEDSRQNSGLLSSNTLGVYTGCVSLNTKNIYYDSMVPNINDILNSDNNYYKTPIDLLSSRDMLFSKVNDISFPQTLRYFSKDVEIKSAKDVSYNVYFGPIENNFSSFMPSGQGSNVNNSLIFNEDKTIDTYSFEDTKLSISSQMSLGIVDIISHIGDIDFDIHKNPVSTYKAVIFSGGDDYKYQSSNLKYPGDIVSPDPNKLQQRYIKISSITTPEFKHNTKLTLNVTFKTLNAGIFVSTTDKSAEVIPELSGLEGFNYNSLIPAPFEGRNEFNISLVGKTSGRVYNTFLCSLVTNTGYYVDSILNGATWKTNYGSAEFVDLPEEEYDVYLFQPHKGGANKDCFALSDLKITATVSYDIAKFPIQEYFPFDTLYENLTREIFNETRSNIEYYQNKRPQTLVSYSVPGEAETIFDSIFVQKHGLMNIKPKESKVYFRDNHYGYYSDLIYTTPYGKQYNKEDNLLNDYLVKINKYNNDFTLADISNNYRYGRSFKPFTE